MQPNLEYLPSRKLENLQQQNILVINGKTYLVHYSFKAKYIGIGARFFKIQTKILSYKLLCINIYITHQGHCECNAYYCYKKYVVIII